MGPDGGHPPEVLRAADPSRGDNRPPRHVDDGPDRIEVGALEAADPAHTGVDVPIDVETGQPGHRLQQGERDLLAGPAPDHVSIGLDPHRQRVTMTGQQRLHRRPVGERGGGEDNPTGA